MVSVTVVLGHRLIMDRTRGHGAPGGWRWVPICTCGWNRRSGDFFWHSPRGSMFPDAYISKAEAEQAFGEHASGPVGLAVQSCVMINARAKRQAFVGLDRGPTV